MSPPPLVTLRKAGAHDASCPMTLRSGRFGRCAPFTAYRVNAAYYYCCYNEHTLYSMLCRVITSPTQPHTPIPPSHTHPNTAKSTGPLTVILGCCWHQVEPAKGNNKEGKISNFSFGSDQDTFWSRGALCRLKTQHWGRVHIFFFILKKGSCVLHYLPPSTLSVLFSLPTSPTPASPSAPSRIRSGRFLFQVSF